MEGREGRHAPLPLRRRPSCVRRRAPGPRRHGQQALAPRPHGGRRRPGQAHAPGDDGQHRRVLGRDDGALQGGRAGRGGYPGSPRGIRHGQPAVQGEGRAHAQERLQAELPGVPAAERPTTGAAARGRPRGPRAHQRGVQRPVHPSQANGIRG